MTEEEAKMKWCPMGRNDLASRCLGSSCMMWRTKPIVVDGKYAGYDGYCGLAGKPC